MWYFLHNKWFEGVILIEINFKKNCNRRNKIVKFALMES
jgi:hypothetical protein